MYARVRDTTGSYDQILWVALVAYIVGGGLLLLLGKYPERFDSGEPVANPVAKAA
jgi:hypothetical protein